MIKSELHFYSIFDGVASLGSVGLAANIQDKLQANCASNIISIWPSYLTEYMTTVYWVTGISQVILHATLAFYIHSLLN